MKRLSISIWGFIFLLLVSCNQQPTRQPELATQGFQDSVLVSLAANSTGVYASYYTYSSTFEFSSAYVRKYNTSGSIIWNKQLDLFGSTLKTLTPRILADHVGNVYLVGEVFKALSDGSNRRYPYIAQLDTNGTVKWKKLLANTANDSTFYSVMNFVQSKNGGIYTLIDAYDSSLGGPGTSALVYKILPDGQYQLVINRMLDKESTSLSGMRVDGAGNVYLLLSKQIYPYLYSGNQLQLVKYSSTGAFLWLSVAFPHIYNNVKRAQDGSLAIDSLGNPLVITNQRNLCDVCPNNVWRNGYIRKMNVAGTFPAIWTTFLYSSLIDAPKFSIAAEAVLDNNDNVYIPIVLGAGYFDGSVALTKLSSAGATLWYKKPIANYNYVNLQTVVGDSIYAIGTKYVGDPSSLINKDALIKINRNTGSVVIIDQ
jgi:hypothetical protein